DADVRERRHREPARRDRQLDVGEEVLHDRAGVALLQPDLDRVVRALGLGAAEREEPEAQPALEDGLLHALVAAALAELDDDALAERLVAALLTDDLPDDVAIRRVGAAFVLLELPETPAIVEELRHRQLEPRGGERDRFGGEPLGHPGLYAGAGEALIHVGDGEVVLGLLADVPDHELQPAALVHELEAVAEKPRRGELAVGLALHHLLEGLPVAVRHLLATRVDGRHAGDISRGAACLDNRRRPTNSADLAGLHGPTHRSVYDSA